MRPAPSCAAPVAPARYQRHRPDETTLYRVVQAHLDTYLAFVDIETGGVGLPTFVTDEFDAFLACGILAHGFLRLACDGCREEKLVAFSCKRRGICPSCGTRRMAEAAAYLVDHVIPKVPVRQWVMSFPIPLRSLFAVHPDLLLPVLQIIHRALATFLFKQTGQTRDQATTGAVTLIQRFGSAANLNVHLHALVLDGVYGNRYPAGTSGTPDESMPAPTALVPIFHPAGAPTHAALQALLGKIIARILRLLTRLGHLNEEEGQTYLAGGITDPDDVMTPLQAAAANYRIAQGPRAGQKVLSLQLAPRHLARSGDSRALCANAHGFSLHAGVRIAADDRRGLEQLCRYITRPAISNERLSVNRAGHVVLKLKTAWRDGTSHHVMAPMEFTQRLAALVPRPRLHLIRFHGVLAPNAKLRKAVVPVPPVVTAPAQEGDGAYLSAGSTKGRMRWAQLLKRVFDIDIERCPHCGGQLKLIAAIEEPAAIVRILTHLGLAAQPPPRAPAVRVDLFQAA